MMNRDNFIDGLMKFTPDNMSEEQMDAIEQFCFSLYNNSDLSELREQLTTANERVNKLEVNHQLLVNKITPLLDMQEDGEYYERCHLAEEIHDGYVDSSSELALKKFAIDNQIKSLEDLSIDANNESEDRIVRIIENRIEELQKEREKS